MCWLFLFESHFSRSWGWADRGLTQILMAVCLESEWRPINPRKGKHADSPKNPAHAQENYVLNSWEHKASIVMTIILNLFRGTQFCPNGLSPKYSYPRAIPHVRATCKSSDDGPPGPGHLQTFHIQPRRNVQRPPPPLFIRSLFRPIWFCTSRCLI